MLNYMSTLAVFNQEREVIVREVANQLYTIPPFYISRVLAETPLFLLNPLIYSAIAYFGVGLTNTVVQFFKFYLALVL